MKVRALKSTALLPIAIAVSLFACLCSVAFAEPTRVTVGPESRQPSEKQSQKPEEPAFHRSLWEGSFDTAGDQADAVAKQLKQGLDFRCQEDHGGKKATSTTPAQAPNYALLRECQAREAASKNFGKEAESIHSQQKVMSVVSKVSDAAALAAVGGVIYSEVGVKKGSQAETYESAAKIQRTAGKASYVTGATDLTLGAYAFVAQKRKLEEMQETLNGKGASSGNARLNQSLVNAVEATKKAAYSHMMFGAGKMAAGYASMWLAKRSAEQAESMHSLNELQMLEEMAAARQAAATSPTPASVVMATPVPYYNNNQPVFALPSSTTNTGLAPLPSSPSYYAQSSGGSSSLPKQGVRQPASSGSGGGSGAGGLGGGGGASAQAGTTETAEEAEEPKAKANKEALGSFEAAIAGGMRPFGGSPGEPAKDEAPNFAAMMGLGGQENTKPAATGLSPTQMYSEALEGTEGTEQGSMSGVNGKSQVSLFAITKEKLNKMFQVGNVGMPKNVDVRN